MPDTKQCERQGCTCQVESSQSYCCPACERAETQGTGEKCTCDNKDCLAK